MESNEGDSIRLTVPATAAAVRITRVGAAGLATRAGFTYNEAEEVRLAVGEAAAQLVRASGHEAPSDARRRLEVVYSLGRHHLRIELRVSGDEPPGPTPVPTLAAAVLDHSVDAWEAPAGERRIVLHKHRTEPDEEE